MAKRSNWINGFSAQLKEQKQEEIERLAGGVVLATADAVKQVADGADIFITPQELWDEVQKQVAVAELADYVRPEPTPEEEAEALYETQQ
jgi:hypothetical protein